jgi:uroporphyrinogen-III synthase
MITVLVTRAADSQDTLVDELEGSGFAVLSCPLIRTEPVPGPKARPKDFDWIVFTSRTGVRHGLPRLDGALPKVAAVGPGTAEALGDAGARVDLVASVHSQTGLVDALGESPGRVLFAGAADAGSELARALEATHLVVYRTVELRGASVPDADLVAVASASAARVLSHIRKDLRCVSIGPSTSAIARRHGLEVVEEAVSSDLPGLVHAIRLAASRLRSSA